jgi:HPt (histidine-containing phosphotransfer) domain-containing protein
MLSLFTRVMAFTGAVFFFSLNAQAKEIKTNGISMMNAPAWLTTSRVDKVVERMQGKLEWTIRRVDVFWYPTEAEFEKAQSFGSAVSAVTKFANGVATVHMGPTVSLTDFDQVFGHELVHVIVVQKYGPSIPKWLEEGLANHLAKRGAVDYKWLAKQPFPSDVHELAHPLKGSAAMISYRYKASQAMAEMLDKKCDLSNLIRLSVKEEMERRIETLCEIKDLNDAFKTWVKRQAG